MQQQIENEHEAWEQLEFACAVNKLCALFGLECNWQFAHTYMLEYLRVTRKELIND